MLNEPSAITETCHLCRTTIDISKSLVKYHGRIEKTYCHSCFDIICKRWIKRFRIVQLKTPKLPGVVRYRVSHEVLLPERLSA